VTDEILRRYTQLPALIYALTESKITLLDPRTWDDKNDSYFLEQYQQKRKLKSVLALCFSMDSETYHHWNIFAGGSAGVCVQFKRDEFLAAIERHPGIRTREVRYLLLTTSNKRTLKIRELPFTKRHAFLHESEFRIIYESEDQKVASHDVPIPLSSIARISLSPWLPDALAGHVKKTLRNIRGCSSLQIYRSTLIGNERWKRMGEAAK
jgi:hypothetical protein